METAPTSPDVALDLLHPLQPERHALGCNSYIVKPVDYDKFAEAIKNLGLFISLVEVPDINAADER